ncbi:MAG: lipoate--protein ligase family protein [bacterium]
MTQHIFRLTDSGLRAGQENIAFDQAMIEAHQAGEIPDTIRFIHFKPVVLVGRHQLISQEVKTDFCHTHNIDIGRRITGGGAIYLDPNQMGWAIVCNRQSLGASSLSEITQKVCEAAAAGLSKLGINAQYRPRNDIEVDGRKISGTGGFFDGDTLIYQGTVLGDVNPDIMFGALNVPQEKITKRKLQEASLRVTTLKELLGHQPDWDSVKQALSRGFIEKLGIKAEWGDITPEEETRTAQLYKEEIGTADFIYDIEDNGRDADVKIGNHIGAGGKVTAHIRLEGVQNDRLREVLITGDFFVTPPRIIFDLESSLRRTPISEIDKNIDSFFATHDVGLLSVAPSDFASAIKTALA